MRAVLLMMTIGGCADSLATHTTRASELPAIHAIVMHRLLVLDESAPVGVALHKVIPQSAYGSPRVGVAPALAAPRTFTVAGPRGSCTYETEKRSYWSGSEFGPANVAMEIDRDACGNDDYVFGFEGSVTGAQAYRLRDQGDRPDGLVDWVERNTGLRVEVNPTYGKEVYRERVPDSTAEVIHAEFADHGELIVRRGERLIARLSSDRADGVLRVADREFLVTRALLAAGIGLRLVMI